MANLVDVNAELILNDIIVDYENNVGRKTYPVDADRLLLNELAYREALLRALMNRVGDQNYPQTATGGRLDYWGGYVGILRNTGESDDDYRGRILLQNNAQNNAVGTRERYRQVLLSITGVCDVLVRNLQDGEDQLLPGEVAFYFIEKKQDNRGFYYPEMASQALYDSITSALLASKEVLHGDYFRLYSGVAVPITGTISVRKNIGAGNINDAVALAVDKYIGSLNSYASVYDKPTLQRAIEAVGGVYAVSNIQLSVPVLGLKEFYSKGIVSINIL
jgi:hypothetical protein